MIKKDIYLDIKTQFGTHSSWTIWEKPEKDNWKGKSNIGCLKCFDNENLLIKKLNTNYIFIGYNPAKHNTKNKTKIWSNFHSDDMKRSQDYKLRYALRNTKYWGSFIIDVYPGIIETDSNIVDKKVTSDMTDKSIKDVLKIIKLFNNKVTVIALGNKANKILKKKLPSDIKLIKIKHYSCWTSCKQYRCDVLSVLK